VGTLYAKADGPHGNESGDSFTNAFGPTELYNHIEDTAAAGDLYYVLTGTYELTEDIDASGNDGTGTNPIRIIGVSDESETWATGDDRPLFDLLARPFLLGDYWQSINLRHTGSHLDGWKTGTYAHIQNCSGKTTGGSGHSVYELGDRSNVYNSEAQGGSTGIGFKFTNYGFAQGCYAHDLEQGISFLFQGVADHCIVATTIQGGIRTAAYSHRIINCTFYNNTVGFYGSAGDNMLFMLNCLFDANTTGAQASGSHGTDFLDYNNFSDTNGTPVSNLTRGPNTTSHDADFVAAASGDFRLKAGSACRRGGKPLTLGVGGKTIPMYQGAYPNYGALKKRVR